LERPASLGQWVQPVLKAFKAKLVRQELQAFKDLLVKRESPVSLVLLE
jgi:hypothetical protein